MSPHTTSREAESQKIPTRDAGSTAGVSKSSRPGFTPTTVDQGHSGPVRSSGLGRPTLLEMGLTTRFTSQAIFPTLQILNRALAWWPTRTLQKMNLFSSSTYKPPLSMVCRMLFRLVLLQSWCSSNIKPLLSVTKAGEWREDCEMEPKCLVSTLCNP